MIAGRRALIRNAGADEAGNLPDIWKIADEGLAWLRDKFGATKHISFDSCPDGVDHIKLTVYHYNRYRFPGTFKVLFVARERTDVFVSELTVTKIIMVM